MLAGGLVAAVVLAAPAPAAAPVSAAATTPTAERRLACLSAADVEAIRDRPRHLRAVLRDCRRELARKVPFARPGIERQAVLASLVAYGMAPYGTSYALALRPLLRAEFMSCGNYGWLTFHLVRAAWGEKRALKLWQAGWDHGAVGNHAQVHVGRLLLDPTVALVARVRYRDLRDGARARDIVAFPHRADIADFQARVVDALANGRYRREDVLYTYTYANWRQYR